jgi:hypothetical protein
MDMLMEHEGAPKDAEQKTDYQPTDQEKKTIKMVEKLFSRARKHRKQYDQNWPNFYKQFRGKQWKEQRPSYRHSEVINMIFQMIQSDVATQMDSRPKIEYIPREPGDFDLAQILTEVADSDWERNNWLMELTESVYDSRFYGSGFPHVGFDPDADLGAGAITLESKDPFYQFPDPNARDVNKKSRYHIEAEPKDVELLKKMYPDKAEFIKPDLMDLMAQEKMDLGAERFKAHNTDLGPMVDAGDKDGATGRDQSLYITCYLLDDEYEEEKKEDGEPGTESHKVEYTQKLKYPQGRKICMASGVLLSDGPIPFDDKKFPFARLVCYILPREFWGMGDVEQLESPQKIFNKLVSFSLDVLTLMGNPVWIVDDTSGVDTDNLFNRPGLVIEKAPGTEVRREEGVQLQPFVLQMIDRMKTWFDDISGNNDVTRGASDGVTAASAINSLQEAAKTRVRQKSRNLDACLQDVGQMYAARAFQFYDAPRVFRITNKAGANKYFKFHVDNAHPVMDPQGNPVVGEDGQPKTSKMAIVQDYNQPDTKAGNPGGYAMPRKIPVTDATRFDVKVSTGSSLPAAKADRINMNFKTFEAGAIDEPALLEGIDFPNWQAVWARVEQRRAEKAAQEAAMAPPPKGAPMGPPPPV